MKEQVIGTYSSGLSGPLVIALGGLHGNEPAGVKALVEVFGMLECEPSVNPDFIFNGALVGLVGHLHAYRAGRRYLRNDLNRHWTSANLERMRNTPVQQLQAEDLEMAGLLYSIQMAIKKHRPDTLVILDLHTTSAEGGIFCIPMNEGTSLDLAKELYAPVVLGLHDGLEGTLLQAAANHVFHIGSWPKQVLGAAFEAGQHADPLSVSRAVAAIVHCLRAVGCIRADDVESRHEEVLRSHTRHLPQVTRLRHVHHINPSDGFKMRPGYANFQPIQSGEHLADDINGPILSPYDGLILMPLYQAQGADGFFICQ